ncbi:hypothetical protein EV363DRAFT_1296188 [Boletus edulis]|nr:hypothetical protein EV363DRAFT_1296188 [Boletus edulis]
MDFDKTSFSVDWFTPGDKYGSKRLSFPKSACISIDDLVSDSPLSFCFGPVDEPIPRLPTLPSVDNSLERACGWTKSAPPSPLVPLPSEPYAMNGQGTKTREESPTDWPALPSPGLLSIADDCASCGVELDASCLDALDEELLSSPVGCFTELCWASAVHDNVTAPFVRRNTRSRAHSFKGDRDRAFLHPVGRDYPGSFERTRPLAAKLSLPLDKRPCFLSSSPTSDFHDTTLTYQEKPVAYILCADPEGRPLAIPSQDLPWHLKKRGLTLTPSVESFLPSRPPPPKPRLQTSKSSTTLRVISDACATFTRSRKKSPLLFP